MLSALLWWISYMNFAAATSGSVLFWFHNDVCEPTVADLGFVNSYKLTCTNSLTDGQIVCVWKRHQICLTCLDWITAGSVYWGLWSTKMCVEFWFRVISSSTHLWLKHSAWPSWKGPVVDCRFAAIHTLVSRTGHISERAVSLWDFS